jgi:NADH-quinone oxidoreductase subunit L
MIVGMAMIFVHFRTFDFQEIFARAAVEVAANGNAPPAWMTLAGILTFMGPVGKSAQFPLHIWLPDAMEGPTPVSALIHAATMVVAGVYLVARMFPFYMFVPDAMLVIALVGGFTALFAATIGICQFDIKKVLAYSTVSQLGFMMAALGCGALGAGVMHLMTHAWFKACLFLGSGSVIHGMHHEQDMRHMGGLRKRMPVTYVTMLVSTLAISGVPLFSGFYSKDAIIAAALHPHAGYGAVAHADSFLWKLPIVFLGLAAAITAFYMFRLIFMTFHGAPRSHHAEEAHESPATMTGPLVVLAVLAVFGASPWILNFDLLGTHIWFNEVVTNPTFEAGRIVAVAPPATHTPHWDAIAISIAVAAVGILLAFVFYLWRMVDPAKVAARLGGLYTTVYNKYYVDEFFVRFVVRPVVFQWTVVCAAFDKHVVDGVVNAVGSNTKVGAFHSGWFDRNIIDGAVNAFAFFTQLIGALSRVLQTGFLHHYVTALAGSVVAGLTLFYYFL